MWIILILLFLLISAAFIALYIQNKQAPSLGHNNGKLTTMPSTPNAISSQSGNPKTHVEPLPFKSDRQTTMEALLKAVASHGNGKVITQESNYLYVIFTSKLFKFKDDVEFYLDEDTQQVHVRSASRAGKSDLGVNLKRYQALVKLYSK